MKRISPTGILAVLPSCRAPLGLRRPSPRRADRWPWGGAAALGIGGILQAAIAIPSLRRENAHCLPILEQFSQEPQVC